MGYCDDVSLRAVGKIRRQLEVGRYMWGSAAVRDSIFLIFGKHQKHLEVYLKIDAWTPPPETDSRAELGDRPHLNPESSQS